MRFRIISIGKWKEGPEYDLFYKYIKRLPKGIVELVEIHHQKSIRIEGEEILKHFVKEHDFIVVLDEQGQEITTQNFFNFIISVEQNAFSKKRCIFIIGGADGLDPLVKNMADKILSLGRMTWPHMLVRGLLTEQLYRVYQIKGNHPYHRG